MSLKKTLFTIALVIFLLLPIGRLLRDQNPWTCFPFTLDESFFAHATAQWSQGNGYRLLDGRPFDPIITAGIPVAWGATAISRLAHIDIAQSGRFFVFLCFLFLLVLLVRSAYNATRKWLTVLVSIGIFGYGISKVAFGPYFVFGFLGEMPAFLAGALAYQALDRKKFFLAGVLAVVVFIIKPTFLFFIPALGIAVLLSSRRSVPIAGLALVLTLGLYFYSVSAVRDESILDYLRNFYAISQRISSDAPAGTPFERYEGLLNIPALFSLGLLFSGGFELFFRPKKSPAVLSAFFLIVFAGAFFLYSHQRPVEKQWSAIFVMSLIGFVVPWGAAISERFLGFFREETLQAIILSVSLASFFSVAQGVLHHFKRAPVESCPSKQQMEINARVRNLAKQGTLRVDNFAQWVETTPYSLSMYHAPFLPRRIDGASSASMAGVKFLFAETNLVSPLPINCHYEFNGDAFSLLNCAAEKLKGVSVPTNRR